MGKDNYSDNSEGVHYVYHKSHLCDGKKGCYIIVGCSDLWENNENGCLVCEGAKRNVSPDEICEILDKYYLDKEVKDPRALLPLVPQYIEIWDNRTY